MVRRCFPLLRPPTSGRCPVRRGGIPSFLPAPASKRLGKSRGWPQTRSEQGATRAPGGGGRTIRARKHTGLWRAGLALLRRAPSLPCAVRSCLHSALFVLAATSVGARSTGPTSACHFEPTSGLVCASSCDRAAVLSVGTSLRRQGRWLRGGARLEEGAAGCADQASATMETGGGDHAASTALSDDVVNAALARRWICAGGSGERAAGGGEATCAEVTEVARRHARALSYEEFWRDFMEPNVPVVIEGVTDGWSPPRSPSTPPRPPAPRAAPAGAAGDDGRRAPPQARGGGVGGRGGSTGPGGACRGLWK